MTQDSAAKRVKAHRVLSLTMILVALLGWGAFAYASHSADVAQHELEEAVALHKADRAQLLETHAAARQEAQGRIAELEQQLQLVTMRLEEASSEITQTGTLPSPAAVSTVQKSDRRKANR